MLQNLLNHVIDHEKVKFIFWLITWIWIYIESNYVVVFFQFLLQFKCLKSPLTIDSVGSIVDAPLVNLVNLSTLSERIATYASFDAFFIDVQWIVHNCIILYTSKNCLDSIFFGRCMKISFTFSFRKSWIQPISNQLTWIFCQRNQFYEKVRWMLFKFDSICWFQLCDGMPPAASHHLGQNEKQHLLAGQINVHRRGMGKCAILWRSFSQSFKNYQMSAVLNGQSKQSTQKRIDRV